MGARRWVQISAWVAIAIYIAAECVSYYNVATTNEFWAAIEVGHYVPGCIMVWSAPDWRFTYMDGNLFPLASLGYVGRGGLSGLGTGHPVAARQVPRQGMSDRSLLGWFTFWTCVLSTARHSRRLAVRARCDAW